MKGRIFLSLFALPFFSVGVWMLYSVGNIFADAYRMNGWVPVEARLHEAGYRRHAGDDSDTYEAYAAYAYSYAGRSYYGNRVAISGGSDNIGDYQQDTGRRLSGALQRGEAIVVYVDQSEPANAIIDRDIRWGLVGFKSIFLFVFGGSGLGLLILAWRAPKEKDKTLATYQDSPWLLNDDWQSPEIRSNSKGKMYFTWGFAAFWNLISAPLPFMVYREITQSGNWLALFGTLFTVVGIGLVVWAVRSTLEWRRFGPAPVTLDPFPGSIGGHVGGTIDIDTPFEPGTGFQLTLANIHSYVSGRGKNRSRKEQARWQDDIVAHAEPGGSGTRLTFRFDVPEGLNESDAERDDSYHIWRLSLTAELQGTDLNRDYDIPVYATAQQSRRLSQMAVERSRSRQNSISKQSVKGLTNLGHGPTGKRMFYPIGRFLGASVGGIIVGGIFAVAGLYLALQAGHPVMGGVFGGLGTLIGAWCLYVILNSLEVRQDGARIVTTRRWLGIPISRKSFLAGDIVKLGKKTYLKTRSGGRHIIFYNVVATDRNGRKYILGEGFKGDSEARAGIELIASEFGIRTPQPGSHPDNPGYLGAAVLTADQ